MPLQHQIHIGISTLKDVMHTYIPLLPKSGAGPGLDADGAQGGEHGREAPESRDYRVRGVVIVLCCLGRRGVTDEEEGAKVKKGEKVKTIASHGVIILISFRSFYVGCADS